MAEDKRNPKAAPAADQVPGDNELALKAMSGDVNAFSSLAARYTGMLRLYIQSICINPTDAEDICQESLRKAYQRIGSFNPEYLSRPGFFPSPATPRSTISGGGTPFLQSNWQRPMNRL